MGGGVDGADAEDYVVLREGDGDGNGRRRGGGGGCGLVWDGLEVGPCGCGGVAPDDLVRRGGGQAGGRLPCERGVVVHVGGEDADVLRRGWGQGEDGEGGGGEEGGGGGILGG